MSWTVEFHEDFYEEFRLLSDETQDALLAVAKLLTDYGPQLGRPYADTLKGSAFANMKELRFAAENGEWRAAFGFDPRRHAIVLVAGDKTGISQQRFYRKLINTADKRYRTHLKSLTPHRSKRPQI